MGLKKYQENKNKIQGKFIIGVDPGDKNHKAVILNPHGIMMGKSFGFKVSRTGYNKTFMKKTLQILKNISMKDVVVAIETSCNLWQTFANFLKRKNICVVYVSPLTTYLSRGMMNHDFSKSDNKDALLIAEAAHNGKYIQPREKEKLYKKLHQLSLQYDKLLNNKTQSRLRLRGFMKQIFPEYLNGFDIETQTSLYLLKKYFTPQDFLDLDIKEEAPKIMKISISQHGEETLLKLKEYARETIGIPVEDEYEIYRIIIDSHITLLESVQKQMKRIMTKMISLAKQTPYYEILKSIKGVSKKLAARFIAEVGNIRDFDHYRQIEKYAGLNLRVRQSGKYSGARHINKLGAKRLSRVIYQMTEQVIRYIPEIRKKYLKRKFRKNIYKKNIIACTTLLLKLIMSLIKENRHYQEDKQKINELIKFEEYLKKSA